MNITVCGRIFNTDEIRNISINNQNTKIFIDTDDDFHILDIRDEEDVIEAKQWIKLQTLTMKELNEAITIIISTCTYFINKRNQCALCPIKRSQGCLFETIPINWK